MRVLIKQIVDYETGEERGEGSLINSNSRADSVDQVNFH